MGCTSSNISTRLKDVQRSYGEYRSKKKNAHKERKERKERMFNRGLQRCGAIRTLTFLNSTNFFTDSLINRENDIVVNPNIQSPPQNPFFICNFFFQWISSLARFLKAFLDITQNL